MDLARTPAGRMVLFTALYFVEGAPIGFLWWSLPAIARAEGAGTERIGALLGWLVLPWALKWLWAPLIDLSGRGEAQSARGPRFTLRAWIVAAQVGMALTLAPLLLGRDALESDLLLVCLGLHAVCAATQDAAIDALMIRTTPPRERGRLAAWMQAGMLAGRSLLGGGALLVLSRVGPSAVVATLLAVVVAGLGLSLLYRAPRPETSSTEEVASSPRAAFTATLRRVLARRTTWLGLAFGATAGVGFEAVGAFAGPLLTERAAGDVEVAGRFFLLPAVAAMALGGFAGGRIADRLGARRGTLVSGALLAAALLAFAAAVARTDSGDAAALLPWLTAVYATIGGFTAASYALFMDWTDPRLGATQFSAFMGATNLCESWAAFAAGGLLIPRLGYAGSFALLAVVGAAALGLIVPRGEHERRGR